MDGLYGAANNPRARPTTSSRTSRSRSGQDRHRGEGHRQADQSWYVLLAPCPNPKYVVAVTDETGGFGAATAAPDARRILAALYGIKGLENKVVKGTSETR